MKVLTICQGGNSRSAGCGYLLKYKYGMDALACGWEGNSVETLRMLCEWAEAVIVMQEQFRQYVPKEFHDKLYVVDVGPDVWCNSLHPEMLRIIDEKLRPLLHPIARQGV